MEAVFRHLQEARDATFLFTSENGATHTTVRRVVEAIERRSELQRTDEDRDVLCDALVAAGFGYRIPRVLHGGSEAGLMLEYVCDNYRNRGPALPRNLPELLRETENSPDDRLRLQQYLLCRVSKLVTIQYPHGLRNLERNILGNPQVDPCHLLDEPLDMESVPKHAKLMVTLTAKMPSPSQGRHQRGIEWFIHFEQLQSQRAEDETPAPQDRFAHKYGSQNCCSVQFSLPRLHLQDIVERMMRQETDMASVGAADRLEMQQELFNCLSQHGRRPSFSDEHSRRERAEMAARVQQFPKLVGKELEFAGRKWNLVATNISGTLDNRYTYTCKDHVDVMDWTLRVRYRRPEDVFPENKIMEPFLRMGQLNTTCVRAVPAEEMQEQTVLRAPDLVPSKGPNDSLNDGCGRVSTDMAKLIMRGYKANWFKFVHPEQPNRVQAVKERLDADFKLAADENLNAKNATPDDWPSPDLPRAWDLPGNYLPSAYQIRYRGCKGMLVVDPRLPGRQVVAYDSMIKFDTAPDEILDAFFVVGVANPARQVELSAEMITILEGKCREDKQEQLTEYLKGALVHHRQDCGGRSLRDLLTDAELSRRLLERRHDESSADLDLGTGADDGGQPPHNVAFLTSDTFTSHVAKLNVPLKDSANVYGVADFERVLQPNEVFLQVTRPDGRTHVIEGDVAIAKTPCLMPDDMVRFRAVNKAELCHLKDVVVFSTLGKQIATKQVSNADLDGDHFHVLWDPELLGCLKHEDAGSDTGDIVKEGPARPWRASPLGNPLNNERELSRRRDRAIEGLRSAVNSFTFCSSHHLIELRRRVMDVIGWGWPEHELLKKLAELVNRTFEAPKHGEWVRWEELRERLAEPSFELPKFPHYYQRVNVSDCRHSTSLFGTLYDAVLEACGCEMTGERNPQQLSTLRDQLDFWELYCRTYFRVGVRGYGGVDMRDERARQLNVLRSITRKHQQQPAITPGTLFKAIAFFLTKFPRGKASPAWLMAVGAPGTVRFASIAVAADIPLESFPSTTDILGWTEQLLMSPCMYRNGVPAYSHYMKFLLKVAGLSGARPDSDRLGPEQHWVFGLLREYYHRMANLLLKNDFVHPFTHVPRLRQLNELGRWLGMRSVGLPSQPEWRALEQNWQRAEALEDLVRGESRLTLSSYRDDSLNLLGMLGFSVWPEQQAGPANEFHHRFIAFPKDRRAREYFRVFMNEDRSRVYFLYHAHYRDEFDSAFQAMCRLSAAIPGFDYEDHVCFRHPDRCVVDGNVQAAQPGGDKWELPSRVFPYTFTVVGLVTVWKFNNRIEGTYGSRILHPMEEWLEREFAQHEQQSHNGPTSDDHGDGGDDDDDDAGGPGSFADADHPPKRAKRGAAVPEA